jgi:hypothetical protein
VYVHTGTGAGQLGDLRYGERGAALTRQPGDVKVVVDLTR